MKIILANILAIYRRELQSYFASPFAYVVAGVFWLLSGIVFVLGLLAAVSAIAIRDQYGVTEPPIDFVSEFISGFLNFLGILALFILPILSMGLYSEERKRGTLELLATSPITNWAVALGKLLGVLTFFITMVLPLLIYELLALSSADPPVPPTNLLVGHGALILMAAAILSLGMFISSLTDSTILAAILTFFLNMFLWFSDWMSENVGGWFGDVLAHLSLVQNFNDLTRGILDLGSVVLFLSYVVLGVFLTAQSIEAFRFQRS